eukprot:1827320-Pleurochrysis_carterae.AAC.2
MAHAAANGVLRLFGSAVGRWFHVPVTYRRRQRKAMPPLLPPWRPPLLLHPPQQDALASIRALPLRWLAAPPLPPCASASPRRKGSYQHTFGHTVNRSDKQTGIRGLCVKGIATADERMTCGV